MTASLPARTLDFGASATASLLAKMTITYGMSERRDQMITYSLFGKLIRNEMPQNQGELDAALLVEDKKEDLTSNLASSWVYEQLATNMRLSDKITDTKIEYSHLYSTSSLLPTSPLGHNSCDWFNTYRTICAQPAACALFRSFIVVRQHVGHQLQTTASNRQTERNSGIPYTGGP